MQGLMALLGLQTKAKLREVRHAAPPSPAWHLVYENKRQPDGYGANRYAYENLALTSSSPIDHAVRVRRQILFPFAGPQVFVGQAVKTAPIPSMAGGIYTGGMLTQQGTLPQLGTESSVDMVAVSHNDPNVMANDVSAVFGPNDPMGG